MKPGPRPSKATARAACGCPAGLAPDDIPLNVRDDHGKTKEEEGVSFLYTSLLPAANDAALWRAMASSPQASPFLAWLLCCFHTTSCSACTNQIFACTSQCKRQRGFYMLGD